AHQLVAASGSVRGYQPRADRAPDPLTVETAKEYNLFAATTAGIPSRPILSRAHGFAPSRGAAPLDAGAMWRVGRQIRIHPCRARLETPGRGLPLHGGGGLRRDRRSPRPAPPFPSRFRPRLSAGLR